MPIAIGHTQGTPGLDRLLLRLAHGIWDKKIVEYQIAQMLKKYLAKAIFIKTTIKLIAAEDFAWFVNLN